MICTILICFKQNMDVVNMSDRDTWFKHSMFSMDELQTHNS